MDICNGDLLKTKIIESQENPIKNYTSLSKHSLICLHFNRQNFVKEATKKKISFQKSTYITIPYSLEIKALSHFSTPLDIGHRKV